MNSPLLPLEVKRLQDLTAGTPRLPDEIALGMPHLSAVGLSETWVLKECGHRHWYLLAAAAGLPTPDFRCPDGEPIYAAFMSVSLREASFERVREHDRLGIASSLSRISRTRFLSRHRLSGGGHDIGEITMISTFVRRQRRNENHSIARTEIPALRHLLPDAEQAASAGELAALRSDRWDTHLGFVRAQAGVVDRLVIDPCPAQDFNGADFLYFASFQAFVDRAEWAFFRHRSPLLTTRRRDIVYRANIDLGERVAATLLQFRGGPQGLDHWYRLQREQDGALIADVFTRRTSTTR